MLTLKQVNKAIAEKGWKCELVKDKDHFYVFGDDVDMAYSTTISVYRLNHMQLESWLTTIGRIVENSRQRAS